MKILGIETSCDDTGISIMEAKGKKSPVFRILANNVASQIKIHEQYGGVYPNLAKREHETNLPLVLEQALIEAEAGTVPAQTRAGTVPAIDAIAVTHGPGLSPCLWTGINTAQRLAEQWNIPLIPVNHMEGHLLISLFTGSPKRGLGIPKPRLGNIFPAIALLVSGGHTQLVLVNGLGKYKILGETRDDAAGECFDKTARILGLPYPGGPAIAKFAALPKPRLGAPKRGLDITLPRPMISTKDYDFSFSGLKTAVLYDWKSRPERVRESSEYVSEMAREIQNAIVEVLVVKTMRAAWEYRVKSIVLGGGVAANKELREQLRYKIQATRFAKAPASPAKRGESARRASYKLLVAPPELCTDNGAMIAVAGYAAWLRTKSKNRRRIEAKPNLTL